MDEEGTSLKEEGWIEEKDWEMGREGGDAKRKLYLHRTVNADICNK